MPALIIIHGPNRGEFFNMPDHKPLVLGRDPGLIAHLRDPSVSRQHVEFVPDEESGGCFVIDMHSRNGVKLNGTRITQSEHIQDGSVIELGGTLVCYINKNLDEDSPVSRFLEACERLYPEHLERMRRKDAERHERAKENSPQGEDVDPNAQTGRFGTMFGRKSPARA